VFSGFIDAPADGKMPANNIEVKINWDRLEYSVSFDSDGGSSITGQDVKYEKKVTKPEDPERTGYQFS
jgi:hypothetical protein